MWMHQMSAGRHTICHSTWRSALADGMGDGHYDRWLARPSEGQDAVRVAVDHHPSHPHPNPRMDWLTSGRSGHPLCHLPELTTEWSG
jgi:hypothetical protein